MNSGIDMGDNVIKDPLHLKHYVTGVRELGCMSLYALLEGTLEFFRLSPPG